jgi:tetratricopeptide (TPR) repeat protein
MNAPSKHNDTKLLMAVAGAVVAGAAAIVFFAGLSADRDRSAANVVNRPAVEAANTRDPATFDALGNVEAPVQFASYESAAPQRETAEAVEEGTVPEPRFEIDPHEDFVARGLEAWHAREFDRAAAYFGAEVAERPDNAWTQYMLGLSAWKSSRLEDAVSALTRSAELNPESIKTPINLSRVQNDIGDYEAALVSAHAALTIDDLDATALFLAGRSLSNLGRVDEALAALEQSVTIDASNGHVHNLIGLIRIQTGDPGQALPALSRAAELEPGVAYIQNNLGMALELTGSAEEALAAYRRANEAEPSHGKARINLARLESVAPQPDTGGPADPAPIQAVAEALPAATDAGEAVETIE